MVNTKKASTNASPEYEANAVLAILTSGCKRQKWTDDDVSLWLGRLTSWIKSYGSQRVEAAANWLVDNYTETMTIAAFKAELMQTVTSEQISDGPVAVCTICQNNKWHSLTSDPHGRHTKCHCPPNKRETWIRKRGILIPPGESLESMRQNYIEFWTMFKELAKKSSGVRIEKRES